MASLVARYVAASAEARKTRPPNLEIVVSTQTGGREIMTAFVAEDGKCTIKQHWSADAQQMLRLRDWITQVYGE